MDEIFLWILIILLAIIVEEMASGQFIFKRLFKPKNHNPQGSSLKRLPVFDDGVYSDIRVEDIYLDGGFQYAKFNHKDKPIPVTLITECQAKDNPAAYSFLRINEVDSDGIVRYRFYCNSDLSVSLENYPVQSVEMVDDIVLSDEMKVKKKLAQQTARRNLPEDKDLKEKLVTKAKQGQTYSKPLQKSDSGKEGEESE